MTIARCVYCKKKDFQVHMINLGENKFCHKYACKGSIPKDQKLCSYCGKQSPIENMERIKYARGSGEYRHKKRCAKLPLKKNMGNKICKICKYQILHEENFEIIGKDLYHIVCPRNDEQAKQIRFGIKDAKAVQKCVPKLLHELPECN